MSYPKLEDYIRILRMLFDLFTQEKAEKKSDVDAPSLMRRLLSSCFL